MLLRRITDHVKTQNWTAVCLDFAIVVFGVFIGIQVSNWNEARQDRLDEAYYLGRILNDIDDSIVANEDALEFLTNKAKNTFWVADKLRSGILAPGEERLFAERFLAVEDWRTGSFIDSTIQELQSSGRWNIVRSKSFREYFGRFELKLEGFHRAQENIADFHKTLTMNIVPHIDRARTKEFLSKLNTRAFVRQNPDDFERHKVLLTPFKDLSANAELTRYIERYAEFYYWRRDNVVELLHELKMLREQTVLALDGR